MQLPLDLPASQFKFTANAARVPQNEIPLPHRNTHEKKHRKVAGATPSTLVAARSDHACLQALPSLSCSRSMDAHLAITSGCAPAFESYQVSVSTRLAVARCGALSVTPRVKSRVSSEVTCRCRSGGFPCYRSGGPCPLPPTPHW